MVLFSLSWHNKMRIQRGIMCSYHILKAVRAKHHDPCWIALAMVSHLGRLHGHAGVSWLGWCHGAILSCAPRMKGTSKVGCFIGEFSNIPNTHLFGGLEHDFFPRILGMSSSQLTHIFQRGRLKPPTSDALKDKHSTCGSQISSSQFCGGTRVQDARDWF